MIKKIILTVVIILAVAAVAGFGVVMFGHLHNEVPAENATPKVDFSKLTYAALGDSITYGLDSTRNFVVMENSYPTAVKKLLGLKSAENYGISGSTVCTVTDPQFVAWEPMCQRYVKLPSVDIISVMGGTNDAGRLSPLGTINDYDTTTFYGAMRILAKGLQSKFPNSFVFFMTPIKRKDDNGDLVKFCQAVKDVGNEFGIPVLDTYNLADYSKEYNVVNYNGDGVHPSEEFHKNVLAPLIADFIRDNYGK